MPINFPTSIDTLNNPTAATLMDDTGYEHDIQHSNENDAIEALETKVGINNSSDANSLDYKVAHRFEYLYGGCLATHTRTDNGNGTVTIPDCDCILYNNSIFTGYPSKYTLTGLTNQALTDLTVNYIVGDYNSGTPIMKVITDVTLITESDVIPILTIFRNGNFLHVQNRDALAKGLSNKIHQSIVKTQRYRRESGLALSETGTRNMILSSGKVRVGAVPITLDQIATATDNAFLWYHNAGVRTSSVIAQYNNTQYDDGTNLATLGTGRYAVNWIFRGVESQKHLYIVLGNGDYTLNQAEAATLPALPTAISSHAVLVAKLIVLKSAGTATSIQSAFDVQFGLSAVQAHNDTTGRDVAGSHPAGAISNTPAGNIAATDVQAAINELDTEKAPLASPTFTGTVTLPKTLEIQDTSADHQYVLAVNELTADRTVTLPLLTGNDEFTFNAHTQTLTNKRINPRIVTATSYTTDTGTSLSVATCDIFIVTAQAGALKFNNPGGTPVNGQKLMIRIKDNGTARALTYDTQFRAIGVTLPTTTVISKTLYIGAVYNSDDTKRDVLAIGQEA